MGSCKRHARARTQAVHQHLIVESPDKEVMQVIQRTTADINALWKSVYLPKVILFGVDEKGQHSHACNGPTAKAVLRHKSLLIETIKKMQPVYAMLERGLYSPGQKVQKVKVVGRSAEKPRSRISIHSNIPTFPPDSRKGRLH